MSTSKLSNIVLSASTGIIGCGWLGTALANSLIKQSVDVIATTSSISSSERLIEQAINAQPLLLPNLVEVLAKHSVFQQQQLVIAIPPRLKQGKSDYPEKIQQLVQAAETTGVVKRIILITSSAIYNGLQGEVFEHSSLDFSANKVQIMFDAEQAALNFSGGVSVLRLAGLVGPKRHPGKFLPTAKQPIANACAKVNLIHQQDAVGLLLCLLKKNNVQGIFNGVSQTHVSKKLYYQQAAKSLNITLPSFSNDDSVGVHVNSRIVNGDKARQQLGYHFIYDDLLAWL